MPKLHGRIHTARRSDAKAGVNLAKRRTWYAEGDDAGDQQQKSEQQGEKYNPASVEDAKKIIDSLVKRVGERDSKIAQLTTASETANNRIKAIEEANNKRLQEEGNYKQLAADRAADVEKYKPLADRAEALEKIIRESNEARIKNVPDAMKALIPQDYAPEKLQAWLNANEALLVKPPAPDYDAGKGGGGGGNSAPKLTAEELEIAARYGMKPEDYAKAKAKLPQKQ